MTKNFDAKYIKNYINDHKDELCCVLCGYIETWLTSASVIFCDGKFVQEPVNNRVEDRSNRTPYMQVVFKDGAISFLYCFEYVKE